MNTRALVVLAVIMASTLACAPGRPRARGTKTAPGGTPNNGGGNPPAMPQECDMIEDASGTCAGGLTCMKPDDLSKTKVKCPAGQKVAILENTMKAALEGDVDTEMLCTNGKWEVTKGPMKESPDAALKKPLQIACTA